MTPEPPDGSSPEYEDEIGEREVARLVGEYLDPTESVSAADLQAALQTLIRATVVRVERGEAGATVVVARPAGDGSDSVRETYVVCQAPRLDGGPTLDWTYLGAEN